jgi:translation initiation factor 1
MMPGSMGKKQKPGREQSSAGAPDAAARSAASPFAGLAGLRDQLPPGPASAPAEPMPAPPPRGPARAVVRYERKGRGGKEATVIEQLGLSAGDLETWCRDLKRALGCGGAVEQTAIALSGDQRGRLPALLEARGVRRVTVS